MQIPIRLKKSACHILIMTMLLFLNLILVNFNFIRCSLIIRPFHFTIIWLGLSESVDSSEPQSNNFDDSNIAISPQNLYCNAAQSLDLSTTNPTPMNNAEVDSDALKNSIMLKLLHVLNYGSYEEVILMHMRSLSSSIRVVWINLVVALCCSSADAAPGHR